LKNQPFGKHNLSTHLKIWFLRKFKPSKNDNLRINIYVLLHKKQKLTIRLGKTLCILKEIVFLISAFSKNGILRVTPHNGFNFWFVCFVFSWCPVRGQSGNPRITGPVHYERQQLKTCVPATGVNASPAIRVLVPFRSDDQFWHGSGPSRAHQ